MQTTLFCCLGRCGSFLHTHLQAFRVGLAEVHNLDRGVNAQAWCPGTPTTQPQAQLGLWLSGSS